MEGTVSQEHGIPVVFDVTAESYEEAAEHLCRVLAADGGLLPSIRHLNDQYHQVESWWFPEARLKHIDRNDDAAMSLVRDDEGEHRYEVNADQDAVNECGCGEPVVLFEGDWFHVWNPHLTGNDDHEAHPTDTARCGLCRRDIVRDPEGTWIDYTGGDICEDDVVHTPEGKARA